MPLIGPKEMFAAAYAGRYAVGAFNVNNMEIVQGIMQVPVRAHALALGNLPCPRGVARLHQLHAALVYLGLKVHGGK